MRLIYVMTAHALKRDGMGASCFLRKYRRLKKCELSWSCDTMEIMTGNSARETHKHARPSGSRLSSVARPRAARAQFSHATRFPLLGKQLSEKSCQAHLVIKCKRNQLQRGIFRREEDDDDDGAGQAMFGEVGLPIRLPDTHPTASTIRLGFPHPVWHREPDREAEWTRDLRIAQLLTAVTVTA